MDTFQEVPSLWDFSVTNYSQMQDEDFMNLLQKQFPNAGAMVDPMAFGGGYNGGVVNPQNVNKLPLPSLSPPSDDSSPSPPSSSNHHDHDDADVSTSTKRKASVSPEDGPSAKAQHTSENDKKAGSSTASRRKSGGNPKDETRLLKRKEQNRAAQRAFRERKEKHVKDLEERVAELEAKNDEATSENDNLRDLLARLQSENSLLKQQQQFTFSMPRGSPGQDYGSANVNQFSPALPSGSSNQFASGSTLGHKSPSPSIVNPLDWSSMNTFDPNRLNLLDDLQQTTATEGAMQMDFGFGTGLASNAPYTSIASNPVFMSFASSFDPSPPTSTDNGANSDNTGFNFDMSSLTAWPPTQSNGQDNLDELLQGYMSNPSASFASYIPSPSHISPVAHTIQPSGPMHITSSSSSPSSSSTDAIFTPQDRGTPESDAEGMTHDPSKCPRNKAELAQRIAESGESPFTAIKKSSDDGLGAMVTCTGSVSFPKTQRRPENVEVLTAWRNITSNPKFKDTDLSELCAEFSKKARCDGQKVVLEPDGVHDILETLSSKKQC